MEIINNDILEFIKENDIKFIRLSFVDLDGVQKNLSIMSETLESILKTGMVFDGAVSGFQFAGERDLKLYPDLNTLHILPWRPQHGRVARILCSITNTKGEPVFFDTRNILINAINDLKKEGIDLKMGTDSEFYLFKTDEEGNPTRITHDNAGYFDIAPLDRCENVRREICLCLEEMGIRPLSSQHEKGPGQNEINFIERDTLAACDNQVIYRSVVKAIASRNGLFASFLPKPLENFDGNGLAINFELFKKGKPLLVEEKLSSEAEGFIAGVMKHAYDCSLIFNTIPNSYERLLNLTSLNSIAFSENGERNFSRFAYKGASKRFELRSIDSACNIYLAVALVLRAGIDGIKNNLKIENSTINSIPTNIFQAIDIAKNSEFLYSNLGKAFMDGYINEKEESAKAYRDNKSAEFKKCFERV